MAFDVTDDDPEMGQAPTGAPPGPPASGPPGGGQPPGPPGNLAAFARARMGPQVSTPGPGNMADSMNVVIQAIKLLQQAAMGLPTGSKVHGDVLKAAGTLSRHIGGAAGMGPAAGIQKTMLGDQLKRTVQGAMLPQIQQMLGLGGQQAPKGAPPQAPMPSTPLPGA